MADSPAFDATLSAPRARPVTSERLVEGARLGHFRIERPLGAGGMGEVYLATDLALDRPVAIKVLPSGVASGSARDRLVREARAQARVHHPNVGHIYFIGEDDGRLYFAMEYVAGDTLANKIARAPLQVDEALAVIHGAALGLREAQRHGFLHRDVKPSNLMVDAHGMIKVLDFGLVAGTPGQAVDGPLSVEQTTLAGTPLYMAPEQARGESLDLRADIYALGATLFHLVSGNPPFQASSITDLVTMHATAARPSVPRGGNPRTKIAEVDRLIARMMAPRVEDRFATYDELIAAIELAWTQRTRPAGFVVRSMASLLDGILVALVLGMVGLIPGLAELEVLELTTAVYLVYTGISLRRWGTTLGKSVFELEVVDFTTGGRLSWRASWRRAIAMCLVAAVLDLAKTAAEDVWLVGGVLEALSVVAYLVLGGLLLHAALRVPGRRAPWDRFGGTIVRYRRSDSAPGTVPRRS